MTGDSDFYEDDEPLEDVLRAFRDGEKYITEPPPCQGMTLFFSFASDNVTPLLREQTQVGNPSASYVRC